MTTWYRYPVTHGFYSQYEPNVADTPHYAIDIGLPFHTPVTAIKSGTVVQADYATWSGRPGGGEIFIKPDDGSEEYYYYHFDDNEVVSGQHVQAGQLVGLSGGQNSGGDHPTDPMWSTGPHVHVGYFDKFINTPVGSRPFGPDIGPTIQAMKLTGLPSGGNIGIPNAGPSSNSPVSITNGGLASTVKSGLIKVGIFLVALVIIAFGFYLLFKKQIDSGIHTSIETGKKIAEIAAV